LLAKCVLAAWAEGAEAELIADGCLQGKGGACTSYRGAGAAKTPAWGIRQVPGASMGCWGQPRGGGRGQAGLRVPPWPRSEVCGVSALRGGLGSTGEGGREGWKTHRVTSEMSGEVHCEGWQLLPRRSAAAIGCPPSCIFMYIHECAAPNGAAVRPAAPTDLLLRPRTRSRAHVWPSPVRSLTQATRPRPGPYPAPSAPPARFAPGARPGTAAAFARRLAGSQGGFSREDAGAWGSIPAPGSLRGPWSPSLPLRAAAPLLAAVRSPSEIIFSGVDQLCKAVGENSDSEAELAGAGGAALRRS